MKILRARFQNFRLLRDVEIDFSTDPDRPLTVIRAENESGKTTLLVGLQWGLYGDYALPGRASEFRLHPINWEESSEQAIISVEIDLELSRSRSTRQGSTIYHTEVYRITRTAQETVNGTDWQRDTSSLSLHHRTEKGWDEVHYPDRVISDEIPEELREVFFTDGDRALTFIEAADTSSKRDRVKNSIRSLLGLDIIEAALNHVKATSRKVNAEAKSVGANESVEEVATELENAESEIEGHGKIIEESRFAADSIELEIRDLEKELSNALIKGNRVDLERRRSRNNEGYKRANAAKKTAVESHSELFRSMAFSRDLIGKPLQDSMARLDALRTQKRFPKTSIPVLEDILKAQVCVCGASLGDKDSSDQHRREHIENLIEDSRQADELQEVLTELFYSIRTLSEVSASERGNWVEQFDDVANRRDSLDSRIQELGKEARELDIQIKQLDDVDTTVLQNSLRELRKMRDLRLGDKARSEAQRTHWSDQAERLRRRRDRLLREQTKGAIVLANLNVAQDVKDVLERAYERITHEELTKVSNLMNTYFLEMIGSDPEQGSVIRRAAISKQFDILVYGTDNRELRPDRDINGAARRALTLAFIMALTKVSEVVAPNIIDTPLGMMSGYIKRAVLTAASRESSQLVLLLTRSEIAGCEDIVDAEAGRVFTLTNTGHYPRMLEFEPDSEISEVVRCECDHRSACQICQRRVLTEAYAEV